MLNYQACVLTCMDFRIQEAVAEWLRQKGLADYGAYGLGNVPLEEQPARQR